MELPQTYFFTQDHEWISLEGDIAKVGITEHAQEELSDIVFVELPSSKQVVQGDSVAVVESVKAASDIYAPLAGEVLEGNAALEEDPSLINSDPYQKGWIYTMRLEDAEALSSLMDSDAYAAYLGQ